MLLWRLVVLLSFVCSANGGLQVVKLFGDKITLACSVGSPSTDKVTWQLNDKDLMVDSVRVRQPSNWQLEVKDIRYSDSGNYSCYVDSKFINSTTLVVEGKPRFTDSFLVATPRNGTKLTLECAAMGRPLPSISWLENSIQLKNQSHGIQIKNKVAGDILSSKLTIQSIAYWNNGSFTCVASNRHGSVKHTAPVHVHVPAFIVKPPQNEYRIRKGANVTLKCKAFGIPRPTVLWHPVADKLDARYTQRVIISGFTVEMEFSIHHIVTADSKNYTCIVVNPVGKIIKETTRVTVLDAPNCCQISTHSIGSRSLTVQWRAFSNGNEEIIKYKIVLKSKFTSRRFHINGNVTTMKFEGLTPGVQYQIGINAENSIGASNTSYEQVKTLNEEYTRCIELQQNTVEATSLSLTWIQRCNLTTSGDKYVDLITFLGNTLVNIQTSKRNWRVTSQLVSGLSPYTTYRFKIREVQLGQRRGYESQVLTIQTGEAAPSPPRNINNVHLDATTLEITWSPPKYLNGKITEYELYYGYFEKDSVVLVENRKSVNAVAFPERRFVLKLLMMNTNYNISIRERTKTGLWSERSSISVKIKEGVPSETPQNVSYTIQNDSLVTLRWNRIPRSSVNGDLIGYVILIQDITGQIKVNNTVPPSQLSMKIDTLVANRQYKATIFGLTRSGGGKKYSFNFFTANGVPSVPRGLSAIAISSETLMLRWQRPEKSNGIITRYEIKWRTVNGTVDKRSKRSLTHGREEIIHGAPTQLHDIREHFIRNLAPYSVYSFKVREGTAEGWGPFTDRIQAITLEGESSPPLHLQVLSKTSSSITCRWEMPKYPNGKLKGFVVSCYQGTLKDQKNITFSSPSRYFTATCFNLESYTETIVEVYAFSSVIGKSASVSALSAAPEGAFPWLPIIGGCVGFIVFVALIITVILLCRRKAKYIEVMEAIDDVEMNGVLNSRPIHIANLKQYVLHNHTNSDHGFFTEFESIKPTATNLTWEHSQSPANQHKNRYNNIVAYDQTRVILSELNNDPSSTYINANFIDGYKHPKKFIATQGPLPETVNDFWRMIYEHECQVIVMLTKIVEDHKVKCEEYWPDRGYVQYGAIVVKMIEVTELSDYVVRTFSIKSVSDVEAVAREVKQYHYLGWPDHGMPEYPTSVVAFTKYVTDNAPPKTGPIVVHCSAGVGRTGTLIVIDAMLNQIREENIIDVYKYVSMIRRQRNFMVQTEVQYIFIYDALLDAVICGNTEATAHDIAAKLRYLDQQSHDTADTYLMQEFKRLEAGLNSQEKELFSIANLAENKEKNRFLNILPYNRNRVKLAFIYGQKGSDYINASYVDGYRQRHTFIATQGPLENTVADFWRMVWEQNCHNIVMLTKLVEKGKERSRQYWPSCGSECYGKFLVDELRERDDECENVVVRELSVTYTETGRTRRVYHYLYTGWPEYGSPNSGTDLIKLVSIVNEMKSVRGTGPVVVHCCGGAGRTGTFIALYICIQKLKTEGTVDIFQTVRQLRTQRTAMVQTVDQYYFCYQALKDYVDTTADISKHYDMDESLA